MVTVDQLTSATCHQSSVSLPSTWPTGCCCVIKAPTEWFIIIIISGRIRYFFFSLSPGFLMRRPVPLMTSRSSFLRPSHFFTTREMRWVRVARFTTWRPENHWTTAGLNSFRLHSVSGNSIRKMNHVSFSDVRAHWAKRPRHFPSFIISSSIRIGCIPIGRIWQCSPSDTLAVRQGKVLVNTSFQSNPLIHQRINMAALTYSS